MATAIQIAMAAALISAWIWVLGRPLVGGLLALFGRGAKADGQDHTPDHRATGTPPRWGPRHWLGLPPTVRRRQLMLATLFACFASFLLAIALRGRSSFLALFCLMLLVLVSHLAFAAHQGGKIVAARQGARIDAARRRVTASGTMTIRASRLLADIDRSHARIVADEVLATYPVGATPILSDDLAEVVVVGELEVSSLVEELIEKEWGSPRSAAADLASVDVAGVDVAGVDVAGLGEPAPSDGTAIEVAPLNVATAELPPEASTVPAAVGPTGEPAADEATAPATEATSGDSEPIFTRASIQATARPRRKARPIYIHSQLDEVDFVPPRAVNHP